MELKHLTHFFNKRIYVVPEYQRGFSWKAEHIKDLLTDINHSIRLDSHHYTGTITIHPQSQTEKIGLNNYDIFNIVDGQQRFTSLILILSYIIGELKTYSFMEEDALEKEQTYIINKGSYLFRYSIDKVSENYFRSLILEHENLSSLEENLYTRNLAEAKKTIKEYFQIPEHEDRLLDYLNAIEERLQFNEYIVSNTSEIGIVFETMNNRGIELSNLEIVKNRLLYLTSKIKLSEEDESKVANLSEEINNKWATILKNLTLPKKVLDEDTFLNNHWIIYNGWEKDNQAKDEILNKKFSIYKMVEDPVEMISEIQKYIKSLASTSLHWRFINYPEEDRSFIEVKDEELREKIKAILIKLNRLSNSTVLPLILTFMPLMKSKPEFILELAELAERFSFRLFSMNKRRSDTGKNDIYRGCNVMHRRCEEEYGQKAALYYLAWYIDTYGDRKRFELEVDEWFASSKKEGYYSWMGLVYFLYEYEEYLIGNENRKVPYEFAKNRSKSIEHILPQTISTSQWKDVVYGLSESERKRCLHSLGNLLLISAPKNSSLQNSDFSVKLKRYKTGSYSENEIAKKHRIWSVNKIMKRENELKKFIFDRWGMNENYLDKYPFPQETEADILDEYEEESQL